MKINIDSGLLQVAVGGQVLLHSDTYGDQIVLGRCESEGFISSPLVDLKKNEVQILREALVEFFFEEREGFESLPQREWPDEVVSFLNLEDLPQLSKLEALVTLDEKDLGLKRRYLNDKGHPCQGIYRESSSGDLLLIREGKLQEKKRPTGELEGKVSWEGCLMAESLGPWFGGVEVINLEEGQWSRMENGKASLGAFHFGLLEDLHKKGVLSESLGWECRVYPHIRREGHFRMRCWVSGSLRKVLGEDVHRMWSEKYPSGLIDWEKGFGEILDQIEDQGSKAFKELVSLMEGVPPLWVFSETVD